MSVFLRFEENIVGTGKTVLQRFHSFVVLIGMILLLDYFIGFPFGFVQLNQLEQLEKIDTLMSSKTLDSSAKLQLKVEQQEIVAHYKFLSDLRLSLNREFTSNISRQATLANISSTAKKSKIIIPNFLCSKYAYTISLTILWILLIITTFKDLINSTSVLSDLMFTIFLSFVILLVYLIVDFIPKFDSCILTHLTFIFINVIVSLILVILMSKDLPESKK